MREHSSHVRGAVMLGLALALSGCAARSTTVATQPAQSDLSRYTTLALAVDSALAEDIAKEKDELAAQTLAQIRKGGALREVRLAGANEAADGTLLMKVTVTKLKKIGGTKRFFAGAFAGRANVTLDVQLIDAASGKLLATHKVTGESGGTGVSGGTDDAIQKAAEGLAKLVG